MTTFNQSILHPEIRDVYPKWKRARVLVEERESEYAHDDYFLTLPNESTTEKAARKQAYMLGFVNQAGALIRTKVDAVYRKDVRRESLTTMQENFLAAADMSLQGFAEIMKNEVAPSLSAYGTVFAVIDKPSIEAANRAEEELNGVPYITVLSPFQVIDFEWNKDGSLKWFKYAVKRWKDREAVSLSTIADDLSTYEDIITWTESDYTIQKDGGAGEVYPNPFGFVPVVIQAQFVDPNRTIGKTSFFSSSRYIFAGNNLLHAANNEVFKNASALLLMQTQDFTDEEVIKPIDTDTGLRKIEQKAKDNPRVLVYQNPDAKPEYMVRNIDLVEMASKQGESYFERAAENEKSALSVTTAAVPESGVSKAYDFADVNNVIAAFALALQEFERQTFRIVGKMTGGYSDGMVIEYSQDFDIRDFNAKINFVKGLMGINFPQEGINMAMKAITPEITPIPDEQELVNKAIDNQTTPAKPETKGVNNGNLGN